MTLRLAALLTLLSSTPALAGDWQPNPAVRHELTAPSETPAGPTESEDRWVESLVANLARGGASPRAVHRFARSSASYRVNGEISDRLVFVSREHPELFLVLGTDEHSAEFVVDFDKRKVSAYAHGNSVFVPPSHKFCVIVLEGAWGIGGIPVSVAADNPAFEGHTVSWR